MAKAGQHVHCKHRVFLRNNPSCKEKYVSLLREIAFATKSHAVSRKFNERGRIHSIEVNAIPLRLARASGKKCVERMVRDSDDAVRNGKTDLPHGFAQQSRLDWIERR